MQDLKRELRAVRKVLWVLAALGAAHLFLAYGRSVVPGAAVAEEPESILSVNVVKIAGHTIVGRKLPVDTQE